MPEEVKAGLSEGLCRAIPFVIWRSRKIIRSKTKMEERQILENSERFGLESHIPAQLNLPDVVSWVGSKSSWCLGR